MLPCIPSYVNNVNTVNNVSMLNGNLKNFPTKPFSFVVAPASCNIKSYHFSTFSINIAICTDSFPLIRIVMHKCVKNKSYSALKDSPINVSLKNHNLLFLPIFMSAPHFNVLKAVMDLVYLPN